MNKNNAKLFTILPLLLFAVFAVCVLTVLMTGARLYKSMNERDTASFSYRTAGQYISTKLRQASDDAEITVGTYADSDSLVITEDIAGFECRTVIYLGNGYLRELFIIDGAEDLSLTGEAVISAEAFETELTASLLTVNLTAGGVSEEYFHDISHTGGGNEE